MSNTFPEIAIVNGARTPMGRYCGKLRDFSAMDLGAIAATEAMRRSGVEPAEIDHCVMGNAQQTSSDAIYGARHVALKAGVPIEVPAITVNRLCGSGMQSVVTAAQMVAGHVGLDITCLDRLYLTGFVAKLQTPGGVIYFLRDHRGNPIASPALFERIGHKFRESVRDWVQVNGVPVVTFKAGERKADVMVPYLQAAADAGVSKVVAVGKAQEFASVWTARRRETDPGGCPQFSFTREQRRVSVFYFYVWDERMGPGFIKICTYFPYPIKVCLLTELPEESFQLSRRAGLLLGTVPTHDRFRRAVPGPACVGRSAVGGAAGM